MSDISALLGGDPSLVPSLDALTRPLTAEESRKLRGDDDARLNEAIAAMTRLVESRPDVASALAKALEYYRAYAVLSDFVHDPRGPVAEFESEVRNFERTLDETLR